VSKDNLLRGRRRNPESKKQGFQMIESSEIPAQKF
jgi:hypothetical protein